MQLERRRLFRRLATRCRSERAKLCEQAACSAFCSRFLPSDSARAALAYLARSLTTVTSAGLVPELEVSRAESVRNPSRQFATWLATDAKIRERLRGLERELQAS
jgi:hypothetical protein